VLGGQLTSRLKAITRQRPQAPTLLPGKLRATKDAQLQGTSETSAMSAVMKFILFYPI
jgi:hypothetical protein